MKRGGQCKGIVHRSVCKDPEIDAGLEWVWEMKSRVKGMGEAVEANHAGP